MTRQVLPSGPIPARIMVVGEAPGAEEDRTGSPFMGASGNELTKMLQEAGINRNECFITNLIRIRPPGNDLSAFIAFKKKDVTPSHVRLRDKMVLKCVEEGYNLLLKEVEMANPNLIICLGNASMWALTGKWGITEWRGSVMKSDVCKRKIIVAYHPAAVLRQWSWRPILVHDLRRAKRESSERALKAPQYDFSIRPSMQTLFGSVEHSEKVRPLPGDPPSPQPPFSAFSDLRQLNEPFTPQKQGILTMLLEKANKSCAVELDFSRQISGQPIPGKITPPLCLAVDIETRQHHITCIGIAWSKREAVCIPLTSEDDTSGYWSLEEEAQIIYQLYKLLTHPSVEVIGQNWIYDSQHILKWWNFVPNFKYDTMLCQHVLFPGTPKALDHLASLYCEEYCQWKGEARQLWKSDLEEKKDA